MSVSMSEWRSRSMRRRSDRVISFYYSTYVVVHRWVVHGRRDSGECLAHGGVSWCNRTCETASQPGGVQHQEHEQLGTTHIAMAILHPGHRWMDRTWTNKHAHRATQHTHTVQKELKNRQPCIITLHLAVVA